MEVHTRSQLENILWVGGGGGSQAKERTPPYTTFYPLYLRKTLNPFLLFMSASNIGISYVHNELASGGESLDISAW